MNWLQVGCPFCPSEVNLPAIMVDMEVTCGVCGKSYLVPPPKSPVLAASPLAPLAILRKPGMAGNTTKGFPAIAKLPPPIGGDSSSNADVPEMRPSSAPRPPVSRPRSFKPPPQMPASSKPASAKPADDDSISWESSPEPAASATAVAGDEPKVPEDVDEFEAVQRRLRKEQMRKYARWMIISIGMIGLFALTAFFLRR